MTVCQALQLAYQMRSVHQLHGSTRFWYIAKFSPLIIAVAMLVFLLLRLLDILPKVVI